MSGASRAAEGLMRRVPLASRSSSGRLASRACAGSAAAAASPLLPASLLRLGLGGAAQSGQDAGDLRRAALQGGPGEALSWLVRRCASRLREMSSEAYRAGHAARWGAAVQQVA
eukprot:TRINITY_DN42510_c0_g1_i1.p3 TRINITY_DN42510_c0_g1~~TRINITY_DN42510_c0_g1_i1.p3  ORF type:complete len:114 (-),score=31.03 TRINITY_DN42510_c0_g1_i1:9-350(-)